MANDKKKPSNKNQADSKGKKSKRAETEVIELHPQTKKWIVAILFFVLCALSFLAMFGLAGVLGGYIVTVMHLLFGVLHWLIPFILLGAGILVLSEEKFDLKPLNYAGIIVFFLALTALFNIFIPLDEIFEAIDQGMGGGYIGLILSYVALNIVGFWASLIILLALLIIGLLLVLNTSLNDLAERDTVLGRLMHWIQVKWYDLRYGELDENTGAEEVAEEVEEVAEPEVEEAKNKDEEARPEFKQKEIKKEEAPVLEQPKKKIKFKKVDLPLELLEASSGKASTGNIIKIKEKIKTTLESFNIQVEMGEVNVGPTVTQFELIPAEGIKLSRITALQDDLALALAAHPLRMEAPIPGKSAVGLEVPNATAATVRLKELLESKNFKSRKSNLEVALGKDVSGKVWTTPLEKMPHLLVAGATGSGKSVCLNTIITSLLYQNGPQTLRFIMVDPKKVELTAYADIPHLLTPVITDTKKTVNALKWAVAEMERRYNLLQGMSKRNIESYNQVAEEKMPYIVFIIDELADLMVAARNEVESLIIRLAQMSRAVGIHLVLATQRPSVDVITGLIKANIPTRIAFAVASIMDSRTILDSAGADKLVGKGDMLFSNPEFKKPVRIQGAFLSESEVKKVVDYLKDSGQEPDYDTSVVEKNKGKGGGIDYSDSTDGDEMFDEAKETVMQMGKASTSLLQRKLKIGYSRAARIMDLLEEAGVIGPGDGARPREILITEREDANDAFDVAEEELQPQVEEADAELEAVEKDEELEEDGDDEWAK